MSREEFLVKWIQVFLPWVRATIAIENYENITLLDFYENINMYFENLEFFFSRVNESVLNGEISVEFGEIALDLYLKKLNQDQNNKIISYIQKIINDRKIIKYDVHNKFIQFENNPKIKDSFQALFDDIRKQEEC